MTDMLKTLLTKNIHFIKEITVNWVENPNRKLGGIIDCGAILTLSGFQWVDSYIKRNGLKWEDLDRNSSKERFRFGDGAPMNTRTTVILPFKITDQHGKNTIIKIKVYVVDALVPLLIGKDAHLSLNICTIPSTSTCQLGLDPNRNTYQLSTTPGGHWCIEFQDLSNTDGLQEIHNDNIEVDNNVDHNMESDENIIGLIKSTSKHPNNIEKYRKIQALHRSTNHKSARNMLNMYKSTGEELSADFKKIIQDVVDRCETCQVHKSSYARPKISGTTPKKPNNIITVDLKFFEGVPVLWIIDSSSRYAIGKVLRTKEMEEVVKALEQSPGNVVSL